MFWLGNKKIKFSFALLTKVLYRFIDILSQIKGSSEPKLKKVNYKNNSDTQLMPNKCLTLFCFFLQVKTSSQISLPMYYRLFRRLRPDIQATLMDYISLNYIF